MSTVTTYLTDLEPRNVLVQIFSETITESSGTVIDVLKIPNGLVFTSMKIQYPAVSSGTLTIADVTAGNTYLSAQSTGSAGTTVVSLCIPTRYTAADTLTITLGGATFTAATLTLIVEYYIDSNSNVGGTFF